MLDASHFDVNEAYASIDRHRLEDYEPHVYRTRDLGKTWQRITTGLPLALASPLFGLLVALTPTAMAGTAATLLVGTPALTFIGAVGGAGAGSGGARWWRPAASVRKRRGPPRNQSGTG